MKKEFDSLLKISSSEPNLHFYTNFEWQGYKWRIFGTRFYPRRKEESLHEFLDYLAKSIFGETWRKHQAKMQKDQQHVAYRWANDFHALIEKGGLDCRQEKDGTISFLPSGPALAWFMLGYDFLCLFHKKAIPDHLLSELRDHRRFQSARYEIAAAATLLRAGCNIEWILRNSQLHGEKSCELIATHRKTGIKFGMEAKSKIRPVLNKPGIKSQKLANISHLLKDALKQAPNTLPFVIFLDLNIPPCRDKPAEERPMLNEIKRAIGTLHEPSPENPDPFSCIIATSFGFHYGEANEPASSPDYCDILPIHTNYPLPQSVLDDIGQSVARYGIIPNEI